MIAQKSQRLVNEYLDLYGGHAVAVTGHSHPKVVSAIREQAGRLLFYSNLVHLDVRALAAAKLARFAPAGMKAYFCNSGAEANETALKIAKRFTGRTGVVAMEGSFHGRTLAAVSAPTMVTRAVGQAKTRSAPMPLSSIP